MAQAALGSLEGVMSPLPCAGPAAELRASLVLTAAWVATEVISVRHARRLMLLCAYTADAGGTGNRAQIRVMASAEDGTAGAAPAVGTDVWYPLTLVDSTPTSTDLTGTVETGLDYNLANHAVVVARPMAITLGDAADAGTDTQRYALGPFEVGPYRWFYVACKELGDTDAGDLGLLGIKYNLSL
jgi:hypothetical protein